MSDTGQIASIADQNNGTSQSKMELRLLNCFYNLQKGLPHPFIPMPPLHLQALPSSSSGDLRAQVIHRLIANVHPDSSVRGEISIGTLRASTSEFYNNVLDGMVGFGDSTRKNEAKQLEQSIACALGASSFKDLENALVAERMAAEAERLIQNLAPVFTHMHQWFADHVSEASARKEVFAADRAKSLDFERDILVWTQMERAMQPVEGALARAVRRGALDETALYYLGEKAAAHENALPGIRAWSAAAQGLLEAAQEVVQENLKTKPNDAELMLLKSVLERAGRGLRDAEQKKPAGYPADAAPSYHWAGQRASYAGAASAPAAGPN